MDSNDFLALLQNRIAKEQVLGSLEELKIAALVCADPANPGAMAILRLIEGFAHRALRQYEDVTDAYLKAAKQVFEDTATEAKAKRLRI